MTVLNSGTLSEDNADEVCGFIASQIPKGSKRKMWVQQDSISHWWLVRDNGEEIFLMGGLNALDAYIGMVKQ